LSRLPHARDGIHAARSAARPFVLATRSRRHARGGHPERLQRVSRRPRRRLGTEHVHACIPTMASAPASAP
jgi:hypothetical protein